MSVLKLAKNGSGPKGRDLLRGDRCKVPLDGLQPRHDCYRMSIEEWGKVQNNPVQRDTEGRARKSLKYLKPETYLHTFVAAIDIDGEWFKVDGHTRGHLWSAGEIDVVGGAINVIVLYGNSLDDARQAYYHFDNKRCSATARDEVFGGCRSVGLEKEKWKPSPFALSLAATRTAKSVTEEQRLKQVECFADAIRKINKWPFCIQSKTHSSVQAMLLLYSQLNIAKDEDLQLFCRAFQGDNEAQQECILLCKGNGATPHIKLRETMEARTENKKSDPRGLLDLCASAMDAFIERRTMLAIRPRKNRVMSLIEMVREQSELA